VATKQSSKTKPFITYYYSETHSYLSSEALIYVLYYLYTGGLGGTLLLLPAFPFFPNLFLFLLILGYGRDLTVRDVIKAMRIAKEIKHPHMLQQLTKRVLHLSPPLPSFSPS